MMIILNQNSMTLIEVHFIVNISRKSYLSYLKKNKNCIELHNMSSSCKNSRPYIYSSLINLSQQFLK